MGTFYNRLINNLVINLTQSTCPVAFRHDFSCPTLMAVFPSLCGCFLFQTFTYTIVHPVPGLPFTIVGDELMTTRPLNYEKNGVWPLVVESTDSGGLSTLHTFQVGGHC